MATVKTQGGKVITKAGRVSCECCGECCLYPAQAVFEGKYAIEDLPDFFNYFGIIYTKLPSFEIRQNGSKYCYSIPDTSLRFGAAAPEEGTISDWTIEGSSNLNPCFSFTFFLGTINEQQFIGDLFADTYAINGPISGTVTRQTACTWVGNGLVLRHNSQLKIVLDGADEILGTFKWSVNGNLKVGFQNEPIGDYAGGFSVS
jgi:hypothetical protein